MSHLHRRLLHQAVLGFVTTQLLLNRALRQPRRRSERGSLSIEQAVIAAVLLAVAIGLAALIKAVVDSHSTNIK